MSKLFRVVGCARYTIQGFDEKAANSLNNDVLNFINIGLWSSLRPRRRHFHFQLRPENGDKVVASDFLRRSRCWPSLNGLSRANQRYQPIKVKVYFRNKDGTSYIWHLQNVCILLPYLVTSRLTALLFIILHHQHSQSCQFWRKVKYSISFSCIRINKIGDFPASATALTIMLCLWELRSRDSLSLENPTVLKTGLSNALCTPRPHHMVLRVRL